MEMEWINRTVIRSTPMEKPPTKTQRAKEE